MYAFYAEYSNDPLETLECCKQIFEDTTSISTEVTPTIITREVHCDEAEEEDVLDTDHTPEMDCPWNLEDFIHKNQESEFLKHIPKEMIDVHNESMQHYMKVFITRCIRYWVKGQWNRKVG